MNADERFHARLMQGLVIFEYVFRLFENSANLPSYGMIKQGFACESGTFDAQRFDFDACDAAASNL